MGESFALRTPIINSSPLYLEMSVIVASSVGAVSSDARLRARFLFMRALLLTIAFAASAAAQLTINPSLPIATQGVPYTGQFTAAGGVPPYHFVLDQAVSGFQLSDSGQLTGTPPVVGGIPFSVAVTDSSTPHLNGFGSFLVDVEPPPPGPFVMTTTSLPAAKVGAAYNGQIAISGGVPPYSFSIPIAEQVAAGIFLQVSNGTLYGTPTAPGSFPLDVTVQDHSASPQTVQRQFTVTVIPGLTLLTNYVLATGVPGQAYSAQVTIFTGTPPFSFALVSGALPPGVQLNSSSGAIAGTPTHVGNYNFQIQVTDANALTGIANLTIPINGLPLSLAPTSVPAAQVGVPYPPVTFTASGGVAPYSLALVNGSGTPPPGMTFNSNSGVLSGTPSAGGGASFQILATDQVGSTGYFTIFMTVLDIGPPTLPDGIVGTPYAQILSPGGFPTNPVAISLVSGAPPPGLSVSPYGGGGAFALQGTPTTAGTFSFVVRADGAQLSVTRAYTMTVSQPVQHLHVSNGTLPTATLGQPYSFTITTIEGKPPLTVTLTFGTPTPGLNLSSSGVISGTPTAIGQSIFGINIVDSAGLTGTWTYELDSYPPPLTISPSTIPNATIGQNYSVAFSASGGVPPYGYNLALAAVPGLSLNPQTGLFSGTPSVSGTYTIRIEATDNHLGSGSRTYTLVVGGNNSLLLSPLSLPGGTIGQTYGQTVFAQAPLGSNLTLPVHWAISGGALPPGLSLNSSIPDRVTIEGMPTTAGTYPFHLTGTDSGSLTSGWDYSITIAAPAISIGPATLPPGTVSVPYAVNFTATGGTPPYTFALFNEASSIGVSTLSLSSNGAFQYTSVVAGYANFQIQATDSTGAKGARDYLLTIAAATVSITPAQLPSGTIHQPYAATLTASGGTAPYTFSVTGGTLPNGVSLGAAGSLNGTPQKAGNFNVSITATDSVGSVASHSYQLVIAGDLITLGPAALPDALGNQPYFAQLTASGGTAPYTFTMPSATNWAAGMTVNPDGTITGTPPAGSTTLLSFTVQAIDANGSTGVRIFQINLRPGQATLTFTPTSLSSALVNTAYSVTITASGGQAPYIFSAVGSLPAGLSLSSAGVLAGTPTVAGTFGIHIQATDAKSLTGTIQYVLNVAGPPSLTLTPVSLSAARQNSFYTLTFQASNGVAPYTFSVTEGVLPAGLTLTPSGNLSGTPSQPGFNAFTITIRDSSGLSNSFGYNLTVGSQAVTISSDPLPDAILNHFYIALVAVTQGDAPFTWAVTGGALPDGLSLSGGHLTGTPKVAGQFQFTITVTDSGGLSASRPFTLTVKSAPATNALTVDPLSLSFSAHKDDAASPAPQSVSVFSGGGLANFSVTASGGSWLTVSPASGQTPGTFLVSVNKSGLSSGATYNGQVTITAQNTTPATINIPVTLTLVPDSAPTLEVSPARLELSYVQGAVHDYQQVVVSNRGAGDLPFKFQAQTSSCGAWLSPTSGSASVTSGVPLVLDFIVTPQGLPAGTCSGQIVVTGDAGQSETIPLTMVISGQSQSLLLSQTGLDFQIAPGSPPVTRTFGIVNAGTGGMSWSIPSSGTGWLKITPASGVAVGGALAASLVSVTVDPQGLASGQYYGTIEVDAPDAGNGPKSVTVSLAVLDAGTSPPPDATPSGLILVGQTGQNVTLSNHGNAPLTYSSTVATEDGQPWLSEIPANGSVPANGTTLIDVQANLAGLSPGLWRGTVRIAFADGTLARVAVVLVVTGAPNNGSSTSFQRTISLASAVNGCNTNSDLAVVFNSPADSFQVPARRPVPLQVLAIDCAGNAVTDNAAADVVVQVPGAPDVKIPLIRQGSGLWTATWTPAMGSSGVTLLARVNKSMGGATAPSGMATLSGAVQEAAADAASAVISVMNGARTDVAAENAAGAWVTIMGTGLADGSFAAATAPYPGTLSGTQVFMQNHPLPLSFVSPGQINALIPAGMNAGTQQLTVVRNGTRSTGMDVLVSQMGPGLFSLDGSGQGQGAILAANTGLVAGPLHGSQEGPAERGQRILIYCTGLGAVNGDPPQDGEATPLSPSLTTTATPKVTIGGVAAPLNFSGLAPTLVGIYVVDVQVPETVGPGDDIPVKLTIGGLTSNTVTISVH